MSSEPERPPETTVTLDQTFKTLSRAPRRRILTALLARTPRQRAEFVDEDRPPTDQERGTEMVELYHTHLPHLQNAGFIDWDRDADSITKGPQFEAIRPLLVLMEDHQDDLPEDWP